MTPAERDWVQSVVKYAYRAGLDPIEQLDRSALIHTSRRYREARANALYELANWLENGNITSIIRVHYGGTGATAQDAQRAITGWIRAKARKEEP